jgi:hypothetical protein
MSYVADYNEIVEQLIALGNNEYKPVKRFTDQATAERRLREVGETLEALRAGGATRSEEEASVETSEADVNEGNDADASDQNANSGDDADSDKTIDEEDDRLDAEEAEELLQVQERERRLKAEDKKAKSKSDADEAEPQKAKKAKKAKPVKEKAKPVKEKAKAVKEPKAAKKAKAVKEEPKAAKKAKAVKEPKATAQQSAAEVVLGVKPGTKKSKMLAYLIQHKKVAIPRSKLKAAVFGDEKNCDDSFRLCLGGLSKTMMNKKWGKVTVNHGGKEVSYVFDTTKA